MPPSILKRVILPTGLARGHVSASRGAYMLALAKSRRQMLVAAGDLSQRGAVLPAHQRRGHTPPRLLHALQGNGGECHYKKLAVFTEFSGSACAESAIESVVSSLGSNGPEVHFASMADIKPQCRTVCMATRRRLRWVCELRVRV